MKKLITPIIACLIIIFTIIYLEPITNYLSNIISKKPDIIIENTNEYSKKASYLYVQYTDNFVPYSFQDMLNIFYTVIDSGWNEFTFYCPDEYKKCLKDAYKISGDELILTHLNNYVHPFNSFTNIKTSISDYGEINIKVYQLYADDFKEKIINKVDELINKLINNKMTDDEKIKTIHDYIINNTKYDVERNLTSESKYNSYNAYGPLFEGYATCNGYTDLMAIFLTRMGYDNYKIATTPDAISYSATGHIWNAVKIDDKWLHLDLTWDDPISSDNKDYLFYTYFLKTTEEVLEADDGETKLEEHNFNKLYYLEFNN